jgi:hypothetical protein
MSGLRRNARPTRRLPQMPNLRLVQMLDYISSSGGSPNTALPPSIVFADTSDLLEENPGKGPHTNADLNSLCLVK